MGKYLVKKFDCEYPSLNLDKVLDYLMIKKKKFNKICNNFKSPYLRKKTKKRFILKHTINSDGTDDR